MAAIFLRTVIICIILMLSMRFSGRKQLGQLQLPEIIIMLVLSEVAALPLTDADIPLLYAVIPILTLSSLEVIFSYLATKSSFVKRMVGITPSLIINKGKIDEKEMKRMRMSLDDLLVQLRQNGIASPDEAEYVILEENGSVSVILRGAKRAVSLEDIGKSDKTGMAHPVIIDGHSVTYSLKAIDKDEKWLSSELKKQDMKIRDVFLMTVDDSKNTILIKKENATKK